MDNTNKIQVAGNTLIKPLYEGAVKLSNGDPKLALNLYKMFMETANQETHFGMLSPNIMNVTPIQVKDVVETSPGMYSEALSKLGGLDNTDTSNPDTSMKLGMATLVSKLARGKYNIDTQEGRAQVWKEIYNTKAGKGTPEKFLETNNMMDWTKTDEWDKSMQTQSQTQVQTPTFNSLVKVTSSSGKIGKEPNQTGLEGLRQETINVANNFTNKYKIPITLTGGTEKGHAKGKYSHEAGYKMDWRLDKNVDGIIKSWQSVGKRKYDGAIGYKDPDSNAIFYKEGNHWDIIVK